MQLRDYMVAFSVTTVAVVVGLGAPALVEAQGAQSRDQGHSKEQKGHSKEQQGQRKEQREQSAFPQGGSVGMQPGTIQGRIMARSDDTLILRQPSGQEMIVFVNRETVKDLQVGDEIEASVKGGGRADSVKKMRGAEPGGGVATSGTTGVPSMSDKPAH